MQGESDHSPAIPGAPAVKARHLSVWTSIPGPAHGLEQTRAALAPFVPLCYEQPAPGGKLWQ